jgi:putative N6-adenine-specific DNA methylase
MGSKRLTKLQHNKKFMLATYKIELEETYSRMGDFLKQKCKGYWGYIFTGNLELAKKIGLKPKRRIEFYTGKIDCRLFEYELYAGSREVKEV